jgi:hypothetical protein
LLASLQRSVVGDFVETKQLDSITTSMCVSGISVSDELNNIIDPAALRESKVTDFTEDFNPGDDVYDGDYIIPVSINSRRYSVDCSAYNWTTRETHTPKTLTPNPRIESQE